MATTRLEHRTSVLNPSIKLNLQHALTEELNKAYSLSYVGLSEHFALCDQSIIQDYVHLLWQQLGQCKELWLKLQQLDN